MDKITLNPKLLPTRYPELFRLETGDQTFLISKDGVSIRKEIICHKEYSRVKMENSVALHLDFKETFIVKNKLLEVRAIAKTTYGPLGDRLVLKARYDEKEIGNFSALRSYMGGGINGKWPLIKTEDQTILFSFSTSGMFGSANELKIERYLTLIPDDLVPEEKNRPVYIKASEFPEEYLQDDYTFKEAEKFKQLIWMVPVKDESKKILATISCFQYPGFERFRKVYYGSWDFRKYPEKSYIGRSISERGFYSIQFKTDEVVQNLFPWKEVLVSHETK
jgi:hypothetical protein